MTGTFVSLGPRARWVVVVLVVVVVADLASILSDAEQIGLMNRVIDGNDVSIGELEASDDHQAIAGFAQLGLLVLSTIVFLRWFSAAYRNLVPLGAASRRFKPGWAIGAWFVPVLNLWRPKQIANDIWRASEVDAPPEQGEAWRDGSVSPLVTWWWAAWVAGGIVGNTVLRLSFSSDTPESLRDAASADVLALVLDVVAAVLAILVVRAVTARQQLRAARLSAVGAADPIPA